MAFKSGTMRDCLIFNLVKASFLLLYITMGLHP